jgi:hypothetical protein
MQTFQPDNEKLGVVCNMGAKFSCGGAIMIIMRVLIAKG